MERFHALIQKEVNSNLQEVLNLSFVQKDSSKIKLDKLHVYPALKERLAPILIRTQQVAQMDRFLQSI